MTAWRFDANKMGVGWRHVDTISLAPRLSRQARHVQCSAAWKISSSNSWPPPLRRQWHSNTNPVIVRYHSSQRAIIAPLTHRQRRLCVHATLLPVLHLDFATTYENHAAYKSPVTSATAVAPWRNRAQFASAYQVAACGARAFRAYESPFLTVLSQY